jgi:hypothetical protein
MEDNMQSCELVAAITAIACTIVKCCPNEELPILAAAFTQLGDTLTTILVQEEACNEDKKNQEDKENQPQSSLPK